MSDPETAEKPTPSRPSVGPSPASPREAGFRVGPWWVDPKRDLLSQGTRLVRVEPKVMDVLVYFAGRTGEVVSREELEREVWRGAVVGYDAVTKTVTKLRHALEDNRRDPRYIQTVPKRGYRFVAESGGPPDMAADSTRILSQSRSRRVFAPRRLLFWIALAGAVAALILLHRGLLQPVMTSGETPGTSALTDSVLPMTTRVLVLPFVVLDDDPSQLYLARALTADLIADLSEFSGLSVTVSETGSDAAVAKGASIPGIRYEVWGGVQRVADRIRAEVRLTDALSGRQLSIERYDRPFEDLFEVQQDIGSRLARALSLTLTEVEQRRVANRYTRSVQAYDLFLQARSQLLVRRKEENARAQDLYLRAIGEDPGFARAYGGLALTYAAEYRNQWSSDLTASLGRALTMAETAVEIDPALPEAHWALGYVKILQRRHEEALAHLDEALRLDPGFGDALALKANIAIYAGRPKETIPLTRAAIQLNPAAGYLYYMTLGRAYFFLDDQVQAVINLREAAMRNPEVLEVRVFLAAALERSGQQQDAEWEAQEILAIRPDFTTEAWLETFPMTDLAQRERLVTTMARLGL
jgi:DNA-binding winged helix-turn-helix (wHTH) protein/TolB-like protein/Flp pilus assembly protein TadD